MVDGVPINRMQGQAMAAAGLQAKGRKRKVEDPDHPQALGADGSKQVQKWQKIEDVMFWATMDDYDLEFILDEEGRVGVREGDGMKWYPAAEPLVRPEWLDREWITELERALSQVKKLVVMMVGEMWMTRGDRG